jgi:hypothetical protein
MTKGVCVLNYNEERGTGSEGRNGACFRRSGIKGYQPSTCAMSLLQTMIGGYLLGYCSWWEVLNIGEGCLALMAYDILGSRSARSCNWLWY